MDAIREGMSHVEDVLKPTRYKYSHSYQNGTILFCIKTHPNNDSTEEVLHFRPGAIQTMFHASSPSLFGSLTAQATVPARRPLLFVPEATERLESRSYAGCSLLFGFGMAQTAMDLPLREASTSLGVGSFISPQKMNANKAII